MKKTAAIYVRVSTPDQHVESQLYDLRQFAEQRGLEVSKEYADRGISGSKARRPGLDALMADARQKKFSVVLVAAFDRVARSTRHFLQVVDEFTISKSFAPELRRNQTDPNVIPFTFTFTCRTSARSGLFIRPPKLGTCAP